MIRRLVRHRDRIAVISEKRVSVHINECRLITDRQLHVPATCHPDTVRRVHDEKLTARLQEDIETAICHADLSDIELLGDISDMTADPDANAIRGVPTDFKFWTWLVIIRLR